MCAPLSTGIGTSTSKWTKAKPVVAHEFEGGPSDAVEEGTAVGVGGGLGRLVPLEADDIDFEDNDDEVGEGADVVARAGGPLDVDVIGLEKDEVRARVGEEPDGAIIDAGGALHHLVRRETHGGRNSVSVCP
ncbi:hypothetical protein GYH30_027794 [Glycine max]|nr:hypothetical protein GYH30_027794 [Glycine max]